MDFLSRLARSWSWSSPENTKPEEAGDQDKTSGSQHLVAGEESGAGRDSPSEVATRMEKIQDGATIESSEDAEGRDLEADGEDIFYDSLETQVGKTKMTNLSVTYQCTDGSGPEVRTNQVGESNEKTKDADRSGLKAEESPGGATNLGNESVEGSPPGATKVGVEGSPPGTSKTGVASKADRNVADIPLVLTGNPVEGLKSGQTVSKIGNWADEVEKMKASFG